MRPRVAGALAGLLVVIVPLAACGGDDDTGTPASSVELEGEYEIVSDQEVAKGLGDTTAEMTALAAAPETATDAAVLDLYELWGSYEGTIKENEPEMYLAFEDALGVFKKGAESGDAVGMQSAITDFGDTAAQYLAAHPG
jgi:hypothetical protein